MWDQNMIYCYSDERCFNIDIKSQWWKTTCTNNSFFSLFSMKKSQVHTVVSKVKFVWGLYCIHEIAVLLKPKKVPLNKSPF